ncbi:MAG TPA: hypothetical protein VFD36_00760 [Kofleriaceae bacterium]|jgi:hypothetical protein|nr:hypothetical protein [Kofleriaceae bacterium]
MTKLLSSVGLALALAMASVLAGCQLYFGNGNDKNGPNGGSPPGAACTKDSECAAGCFCENGTCAEGGFCGTDKDCGNGFHCDAGRSSCIPNPACTANEQCKQGLICDNGGCLATCTCANDADAVKQGAGWCDTARSTCMMGTNPLGACTGAITCTVKPPDCPEGQVAGRKDGCFTSTCRAINECEAAPECKALTHEADCKARSEDCRQVTIGVNCHRPDGSNCNAGDTNCICLENRFNGCDDLQ